MNENSDNDLNRRRFLLAGLRGAGGAWASLHWPAIMAAAQHAAQMREAIPPAKLEVLTTDQAAEIEAAASRIIPTDDTPGAREAGVIYFIDRALATFAADSRDDYEKGSPGFAGQDAGVVPQRAEILPSHCRPAGRGAESAGGTADLRADLTRTPLWVFLPTPCAAAIAAKWGGN